MNMPQADAPLCPGPREHFQSAFFAVPEGACDTHAHVISADVSMYPLVPHRSYTPTPAPEDQYLKMLQTLHLDRGVLVQPSVYGTDNRYMLDVLSRHPQRLRGVAVIDDRISDRDLESMHAAGVRGVRFNVLFRGGVDLNMMERVAARICGLGWHLQFLMDTRNLPPLAPRMARLPCPVVIDHMGHLPAEQGIAQPGFQLLLHHMAHNGWWVKLSGAYRLCDSFPDYALADALAIELIKTSPDRLVWGSDWPHVAQKIVPDTGILFNRLKIWAPSDHLRQKILVDNPASLYGFS